MECLFSGSEAVGEDYLKHCSQIDRSEMERLVRSYWKDVWHFAFLLTKKYDVADDIAQETFIRAFRSLHSFRGESTVKTWLLKISRNLAVNHKRSSFFRKIVLLNTEEYGLSVAPSAEAAYWETQFADEIWELVLRLPVKQREVILLNAHYQMPLGEIAAMLGLPEGTVKSRLHRARRRLEEWLQEGAAHGRTDTKPKGGFRA